MSDTELSIQEITDDGRIDDLIGYFKEAAFQWRDQFMKKIDPIELLENYPIDDFLSKTVSDITEEEFLERFGPVNYKGNEKASS